MAKFRYAIIAAAALFCLFTVSVARAPPKFADVTLPLSDAVADPAATLRLPTELADAKPNTEAVPIFRPVNRRFQVKRPCRHHFKFYPTMRESEPIPYANDMILASGDFDQPIASKRIPGRWMRTHHRHHHLRHRRAEDTDSDNEEEEEDRVKKVVFKRYDYDRFDREKKLKLFRQHFRLANEKKEEEKKKPKKGFMKGVRKFLDNYF